MTDDELAAIEAHAYGGLPPGDGEHYVELLVAEVRRLRERVKALEAFAQGVRDTAGRLHLAQGARKLVGENTDD
jgi:hypothetical protein